MTYPDEHDGKENGPETLMALLAHVSDQMSVVADGLRTKSNVKSASRGCDIRKYSDPFRFGGREFYNFDAYVEAELEGGSLLCWLVDINCTPSGWEIERTVHLRRSSGDEINTFPVMRAPTFSQFAGRFSEAMAELIEAARSYSS